MTNEKVKLEQKVPKDKTIEYNGVEIQVKPFLTMAEQAFLIKNYIEDYFNVSTNSLVPASEYNLIEAEFGLENRLFQLSTNIDVTSLEDDVYTDAQLGKAVISEIANFEGFRKKLDSIVAEIKEQRLLNQSVGKVVSDLVNKGYMLLDKLAELNPEEIKNIQNVGKDLIERLEKASVLGTGIAASPAPVKAPRKKKA
jgi:hypothetical protein